ncbi:hypothetical protein Ple7327_3683 [Pleurocapsa sp. PCC 7327]|nr:hypothetical protein [Pleurocapsa sp. PCC 7327]AFY78873.1 hypothetical protein Ple7327_3683 [Pleurocapsa sp. PCC 7327]
MKCQLCDREIESLTEHHLISRQAVKRKKNYERTMNIRRDRILIIKF